MTQPKINLSAEALTINTKLVESIIAKIKDAGGTISFAEFMQEALYAPGLGYYQNPLYTFGEKGDFVTAPEISQVFAQSIAASLSEFTGESIDILEIGAGSGAMAKGLIAALSEKYTKVSYQILEPSGALQTLQQEALADFKAADNVTVTWLDALPKGFNGVVIANEVVDALPVNRIQKVENGWQYIGVGMSQDGFCWQPNGPVPEAILPESLTSNPESYVEGYTTEIRLLTKGWIKSLAESLSSGIILLIDYGYPQHEYYHPQRTTGTLSCFSRHQASDDPLQRVGLQDITAHVDFTQLAHSAVEFDLDVTGFTTQAGFILSSGVLEQLGERSQVETYQLSRELQLLMAPGQMGEVVKVIQLSKNTENQASGFVLQDHLHRL